MLFSNEIVATQINLYFEPVWESVRAVPMVTIDFGNGTVVRRTLHGNVATYVCNAQGHVLDILPGIYEPPTYVDRLKQLHLVHKMVAQTGYGGDVDAILQNYHRRQFEALQSEGTHLRLEEHTRFSITRAEGPTRIILQPARRIAARGNVPPGAAAVHVSTNRKNVPDDLASWEALARDTEVNEVVRRKAIHEYLTDKSGLRPADVKNWIYREVLHADLDDPYLGLGHVLFDNYPFDDDSQ